MVLKLLGIDTKVIYIGYIKVNVSEKKDTVGVLFEFSFWLVSFACIQICVWFWARYLPYGIPSQIYTLYLCVGESYQHNLAECSISLLVSL